MTAVRHGATAGKDGALAMTESKERTGDGARPGEISHDGVGEISHDGACGDSTSPAITDVVFDMCGVLVDSRPWMALDGMYPQGVIDMIFDPRDVWGFAYFDTMANCGWSRERVLREYERHHGPAVAWAYRTYLERIRHSLPSLMPGMGTLLRELRELGIGVWGLTNFTTDKVEVARGLFPDLALLQDIVISSEEGLCKPDPIIYRRAIARFGIDPATSLFVDDDPVNVTGAHHQGLQGLVFSDAAQVRRRVGIGQLRA